jgi:hypothetical protein
VNPATAHESALGGRHPKIIPIAAYNIAGLPTRMIEPNVCLPLHDVEMRQLLFVSIRLLERFKGKSALGFGRKALLEMCPYDGRIGQRIGLLRTGSTRTPRRINAGAIHANPVALAVDIFAALRLSGSRQCQCESDGARDRNVGKPW